MTQVAAATECKAVAGPAWTWLPLQSCFLYIHPAPATSPETQHAKASGLFICFSSFQFFKSRMSCAEFIFKANWVFFWLLSATVCFFFSCCSHSGWLGFGFWGFFLGWFDDLGFFFLASSRSLNQGGWVGVNLQLLDLCNILPGAF